MTDEILRDLDLLPDYLNDSGKAIVRRIRAAVVALPDPVVDVVVSSPPLPIVPPPKPAPVAAVEPPPLPPEPEEKRGAARDETSDQLYANKLGLTK